MTVKNQNITPLSLRIYLTSNFLLSVYVLSQNLNTRDILNDAAGFLFISFIFSAPAGLALYCSFRLIKATTVNTLSRWIYFIFLLFLSALIPYLVVTGLFSDELGDKEWLPVLHLSEGSAFLASLLNIVAIHRHFKTSSHENI